MRRGTSSAEHRCRPASAPARFERRRRHVQYDAFPGRRRRSVHEGCTPINRSTRSRMFSSDVRRNSLLKSALSGMIVVASTPRSLMRSNSRRAAFRPGSSLSAAMTSRRKFDGGRHAARCAAESAATTEMSGKALLSERIVSIPSPMIAKSSMTPKRTLLPRMAPSERRGDATLALALRLGSRNVR
jgi:hypothetical protein